MKKHLLVLAMAALFISGCGKKEESTPVGLASAPASAAVPAGPVLDAEKVLNIYNWPDYVPEGMIAAFEKETGIKVNYDTFETNEALHAKLVAGNTGYDIVVPGSVFAKPQIDGGLLAPLDKAKIPNLVHLDPAVMANLTKADPGNAHLVPWAWSFTTVGINKAKVEKALGGMPMPDNAWDLVFDPKYSSKLKSCGIAYLDAPTEIIPAALHYIGKKAYSQDPEDYKAAGVMLAKVRKDVRLFSATMIDDFAGGKACAVVGWSGDINIAAGRAKENGSKDELVALLPKTGGLMFFDTIAVTKDAKHPNNAMAFINFYLRPENAVRMAQEMNYNTGNQAALSKINPEIASNASIFVDAENLSKMVSPESFTNEARAAMANTYNNFKKGK